MVYTLRLFSSKCSLFHNSNIFVFCIIHILYTGCAKIKKKSGAKRLIIIECRCTKSFRNVCTYVPNYYHIHFSYIYIYICICIVKPLVGVGGLFTRCPVAVHLLIPRNVRPVAVPAFGKVSDVWIR